MSIDYYGWSVDIDDSTNLTENDIHSLLKYKSFDDMFSFCQGYITPDDYVFTDVLFVKDNTSVKLELDFNLFHRTIKIQKYVR